MVLNVPDRTLSGIDAYQISMKGRSGWPKCGLSCWADTHIAWTPLPWTSCLDEVDQGDTSAMVTGADAALVPALFRAVTVQV